MLRSKLFENLRLTLSYQFPGDIGDADRFRVTTQEYSQQSLEGEKL